MKRGAVLVSAEFGLYFPSNWVAVCPFRESMIWRISSIPSSMHSISHRRPTARYFIIITTPPPTLHFAGCSWMMKPAWIHASRNLMGIVHQVQFIDGFAPQQHQIAMSENLMAALPMGDTLQSYYNSMDFTTRVTFLTTL